MTAVDFTGAPTRISRNYRVESYTPTALLATTPVINLCGISGGSLFTPTGGPISLAVYQAFDEAEALFSFTPYTDQGQLPVIWSLVANTPNELPSNVFGLAFAKFVVLSGTPSAMYFFLKG